MCYLVLHMRGKKGCVWARMKWQINKYLINKSYTQIRQCKWLMKVKLTLHHGFVLYSLYFHYLHLGQNHSSLWYAWELFMRIILKWLFFSRFSNGSFRIIKLWVLWFFKFILPHMRSHWRVSNYKIVTFYDIFFNVELHASINGHLFFLFWVLMVEIQIDSLTLNLTFNISFGHNFYLIAPNGQCMFIFEIYILRAFQWYKELYT